MLWRQLHIRIGTFQWQEKQFLVSFAQASFLHANFCLWTEPPGASSERETWGLRVGVSGDGWRWFLRARCLVGWSWCTKENMEVVAGNRNCKVVKAANKCTGWSFISLSLLRQSWMTERLVVWASTAACRDGTAMAHHGPPGSWHVPSKLNGVVAKKKWEKMTFWLPGVQGKFNL